LPSPAFSWLNGARPAHMPTWLRAVVVLVALYAFLVGVSLIEGGIAALGEGFKEGLLDSVTNPLGGLAAGILATVLVQSSSVSTSTIVALVGAGTIPVSLAVPMIMGANIGTTITNTLASLASLRRPDEFRRAFAAATMHDFFNIAAVVVLLPVELLTGLISRTAVWLTGVLRDTEVGTAPPSSPIKEAIGLVADPIEELALELLPAFLGAPVVLALGLGLIFAGLVAVTKNMRELVADSVERAMNRVVGRGGGTVGMVVGLLVTVAVQSSSITTSILVPLVAAGLLTLNNAYPITLGANIGTTLTALLASLAVVHPEGLTIALVHTLFNVIAILLLYPAPPIRRLPVRAAEALADLALRRRSLVVAYVLGVFIVLPVLGVLLLH
jgi:solute carrier family 34 (sodium-dependent phosphate cotransporter)